MFYVGLLNILALLGLTIIGTPESHLPHDNHETEAERDGDSGSESGGSSRRSSQRSRSRSGSHRGSSLPPTPNSLLGPLPPLREEDWRDLLKDETDNIVLGLRVYTQTKDPAEIAWRPSV